MPSDWGSSWGNAWGISWDIAGVPAQPIVPLINQITVRRPGGILGRFHISMVAADPVNVGGVSEDGFLGKHRQNTGNRTSTRTRGGGLRGFLRRER